MEDLEEIGSGIRVGTGEPGTRLDPSNEGSFSRRTRAALVDEPSQVPSWLSFVGGRGLTSNHRSHAAAILVVGREFSLSEAVAELGSLSIGKLLARALQAG